MLTSEQSELNSLLNPTGVKRHHSYAHDKYHYKNLRWIDKKGNKSLHRKADSEAAVAKFKAMYGKAEANHIVHTFN